MLNSSFHPVKSDINVTPYIDILLVLLIIFMVIQPVTEYDLKARVPDRPDQHGESTGGHQIVINVEESGRLSINGMTSSPALLGTQLYDILKGRGDKRLFVRGANGLPFGDVIRVIDIAKALAPATWDCSATNEEPSAP